MAGGHQAGAGKPSDGRRPATQERGRTRALLETAALTQFRLQLARPRATDEIGVPGLCLEFGLAEAREFPMGGRVGEHVHQTPDRTGIFHRFRFAASRDGRIRWAE
ncbi:MAG TPA: hypothetical protein VIM27_06305 [Gaiellales bacterium]